MAHQSEITGNLSSAGASSSVNEPGLVSVILPAFNAERFIRRAMESVLAQTYALLEVLVVDDGSTDGTAAEVKRFIAEDGRVRLFSQANAGVAAARNLAIRQARGEFIAPIDADDIWFPRKLEKQVQTLRAASDSVALVYTWSVLLDEEERLLDGCPVWDVEGDVFEALLYRNFIGNASVPLIRRSALGDMSYDSRLRDQGAQGCEDWDLYLRIAEKHQFRAVREYLVGYRQLHGSMSADFGAMARSHASVISEMQARHPEIPRAVFRWSRGHFYHYLFEKSFHAGEVRGVIHWFFATLRADAAILLSPRSYRLVFLALLGMLFPVLLRPATLARAGRKETLADLTTRKLRKSFPWRPFTWLEVRRWLRVTGKPLPSFKLV